MLTDYFKVPDQTGDSGASTAPNSSTVQPPTAQPSSGISNYFKVPDATQTTTTPAAPASTASVMDNGNPIDLNKGDGTTISENKTPMKTSTVLDRIGQAVLPEWLQKEFGISAEQVTSPVPTTSAGQEAEQETVSGNTNTEKMMADDPSKIDPMVYFSSGLGFGNDNPVDSIQNMVDGYDKNVLTSETPQPVTTKQKFASAIGMTVTMAIAQPLIDLAAGSLLSKIPVVGDAIESMTEAAKTKPWTVGYLLNTAKAAATGGLFGLITKNKSTVAQNVMQNAGMFAAFSALAYPIQQFFKPIIQQVGSMTMDASAKNILTDPAITQNPVSQTLWFKNPEDGTQLLKVTANGVEFVPKTSSEVVSAGAAASNAPTLTSLDIQGFKVKPSLYENLTNWIKGDAANVSDVPFTVKDNMPQSSDETFTGTNPADHPSADQPSGDLRSQVISATKDMQSAEDPMAVTQAQQNLAPMKAALDAFHTTTATANVVIKGIDGTPAATVSTVQYSNGKFAYKVNANTKSTGLQTDFTQSKLYPTQAAAVKAGTTQLTNWADSAAKTATAPTDKIALQNISDKANGVGTQAQTAASSASPAVETNKQPLPNEQDQIYYHGTTKAAAADIAKNGFNTGTVALTTDPAEAKEYGDTVLEVRVKKNAADVDTNGSREPMYQAKDTRVVGASKTPVLDDVDVAVKPNDKPLDLSKFAGTEAPKTNAPRMAGSQGGFANAGKAFEDIKKAAADLKTHFDEVNKAVKFSSNLDDTLFNTQKNAQADTIDKIKLAKQIKNLLTPAEWENVYNYREALAAGTEVPTLTPKEKMANDEIITPLNKQNAEMARLLNDRGVAIPEESLNPRLVKNRGSMLDRAIASKDRLFEKAGGGKKNVLKKSAPALKKRVMRSATDAAGNRQVVSVKDGRVTAFAPNEEPRDLGAIKMRSNESIMKSEIKPIQTKIARAQKLIDTLESVKTRDPVSAQKLGNMQARIDDLKQSAAQRAKENEGLTGVHKTMTSDIEASNKKIVALEARLKALKPYGDVPKIAAKTAQLSADIDAEYNHETNLSLSDIYENLSEFAENENGITEKMDADLKKTTQEFKTLSKIPKGEDLVLTKQRIANAKSNMLKLVNQLADVEAKYDPTKIKERVFVGKGGARYKLGEATTKEIEAATDVRYYKNPFVNAILTNNDLTQAYRATQTLEALKNSPEFENIALKSGDGNPPDGWKTVKLDQFRGYYFEPHTADVLNAFAKDLDGDDPLKALTAINNLVTSSVFLTPVGHMINVGTSAAINRGLSSWLNPMKYPRLFRTTVKAVHDEITKNEDYMKVLRAGAPFMANSGNNQEFKEALLDIMGEKPTGQKAQLNKIKKVIGYVNPISITHKMTWPMNDMLLLQQVYETQEARGMNLDNAIKNTLMTLPSYRLPVKVRLIGKPTSNNLVAFLTYKLNTIQSFVDTGKQLVMGKEAGQENGTTADSNKSRTRALDKIGAAMVLGLIVIPLVNKLIKKVTGNPYAHVHEPAQLAIAQNVNSLIHGDMDLGQYLQTIITPALGTEELAQQLFNVDFFTGNKIRVAGTSAKEQAEASAEHAASAFTPLDQLDKLNSGKLTLAEALESLGGIDNPKSGAGTNKVYSLIYDEKPNIEKQMKALIVAKNPQGAQDLMDEFNANLKSAYQQTYADQGKAVSTYGVNLGLHQNGIRMPAGKAISDYLINQSKK